MAFPHFCRAIKIIWRETSRLCALVTGTLIVTLIWPAMASPETPPAVEPPLVTAPPAPVSPTEDPTFGDWRVLCDDGTPCRMVQAIVQPATSRLILQIKVFRTEEPVALLSFPLGILLSTGWQYEVDGKRGPVLPFEICNAEGCHVGLPIGPDLLAALKRGTKLRIRFLDAARTEVTPEISLTGFTKAYEALQ